MLPRLDFLESDRLTSSSRRLAAVLGYLHDEAALRGRVYRLRLDLDEGRYRVEQQRSSSVQEPTAAEFVETWDMYARPTVLPPNVRVLEVETDNNSYTTGTADLYFLPEDASGGVTIVLASEAGQRTTLSFDGTTGSVRLRREDSSS